MTEKTTAVRQHATESDGCSNCAFAGGRCTGHQCVAGHSKRVQAAQEHINLKYGHANVPRTTGT